LSAPAAQEVALESLLASTAVAATKSTTAAERTAMMMARNVVSPMPPIVLLENVNYWSDCDLTSARGAH